MNKLVYILLVLALFLSFTAVNVFACEINKAKKGEIKFAKAVVNNDNDLNIDAKVVSDDELKSVVGEVHKIGYNSGRATRIIEWGKIKTHTKSNSTTNGVSVSVNAGINNLGIQEIIKKSITTSKSVTYQIGERNILNSDGSLIKYIYYSDGSYIVLKIAGCKNALVDKKYTGSWNKF